MRQAAADACSFIEDMDKPQFIADKRTQQAVIMNLIIIGEATAKILERHADYAEKATGVPWHQMRGMRNRVAHGYFDINLDIVWDTVRTALPNLLKQLADEKSA